MILEKWAHRGNDRRIDRGARSPLFRGRVFTFLMENRNSSASEVENNIEDLCLEFERLKPYLLQIGSFRE